MVSANINPNTESGKVELGAWLWARVKRVVECWEFQGRLDKNGYGITNIGKKSWKVHRLVWKLVNGEIEEGLLICHRCDNPRCIRPGHLFKGTRRDNTQDMLVKGRSRWHLEAARLNREYGRYAGGNKAEAKRLNCAARRAKLRAQRLSAAEK